jgi:hypothetical protein
MRAVAEIVRAVLNAAVVEIGFWVSLLLFFALLFAGLWLTLGPTMFTPAYVEIIIAGIVFILVAVIAAISRSTCCCRSTSSPPLCS